MGEEKSGESDALSLSLSFSLFLYIYIYIEGEIEREREREREREYEDGWQSGAFIVYSVDGVNQWIIGVPRSLAAEYHLFGNELFA